jgi:hypothetical protein
MAKLQAGPGSQPSRTAFAHTSGHLSSAPFTAAVHPKTDGRQRPLGIAALEDKIVQRAVVEVLNAIYEEDFLGFSYGFRPGRGQHDALDALAVGITRTKVNWIVDADIAGFFDAVSHEWLMRFVEHRIGDRRINRGPVDVGNVLCDLHRPRTKAISAGFAVLHDATKSLEMSMPMTAPSRPTISAMLS